MYVFSFHLLVANQQPYCLYSVHYLHMFMTPIRTTHALFFCVLVFSTKLSFRRLGHSSILCWIDQHPLWQRSLQARLGTNQHSQALDWQLGQGSRTSPQVRWFFIQVQATQKGWNGTVCSNSFGGENHLLTTIIVCAPLSESWAQVLPTWSRCVNISLVSHVSTPPHVPLSSAGTPMLESLASWTRSHAPMLRCSLTPSPPSHSTSDTLTTSIYIPFPPFLVET